MGPSVGEILIEVLTLILAILLNYYYHLINLLYLVQIKMEFDNKFIKFKNMRQH